MSWERNQVQEGYLPCRESAARPKSQMKPSCPPSVGNWPLPRSTLPVAGAGLLNSAPQKHVPWDQENLLLSSLHG